MKEELPGDAGQGGRAERPGPAASRNTVTGVSFSHFTQGIISELIGIAPTSTVYPRTEGGNTAAKNQGWHLIRQEHSPERQISTVPWRLRCIR